MFLDSLDFIPLNIPEDQVPNDLSDFTLTARPRTDLWRKPPSSDTATAPILYKTMRHMFCSAEVTVSAAWELEWDQAGLVIFAGIPPGRNLAAELEQSEQARQNPANPPPYPVPLQAPSKWVKVAMEYHRHKPAASAVCATSEGADWSVFPLPDYQSATSDLRVKLERLGHALWIYYEDLQLGWVKLREVSSFFWGVEDKSIRVGVYASRPANWPYPSGAGDPYSDRDLRVDFGGLQIF